MAKTNHHESRLQIACVIAFRYHYPRLKYMLFAVPNGGKRTKMEAIILKSEGVISGVSDLILLTPNKGYGSLCIEMKFENAKQSENQKIWQKETEKHGNKYVVCNSVTSFLNAVNDYLRA